MSSLNIHTSLFTRSTTNAARSSCFRLRMAHKIESASESQQTRCLFKNLINRRRCAPVKGCEASVHWHMREPAPYSASNSINDLEHNLSKSPDHVTSRPEYVTLDRTKVCPRSAKGISALIRGLDRGGLLPEWTNVCSPHTAAAITETSRAATAAPAICNRPASRLTRREQMAYGAPFRPRHGKGCAAPRNREAAYNRR